ncbi:hypothetical protein FBZ87_10235 [Nitrospirillum amazonense]|uniref:Uncharacterized protein n=1 Tax=Nitrospirillum amazonense TaxID=28077 RepID=A0A560KCC4_9PROT|nr:hypothetical protein [Nitrospirillum amazonense]TWB79614.1 hypothetical protein FBZ87_10235 [Nitrospirillum amazonense]
MDVTVRMQRAVRVGIVFVSYFMASFFTFLPDGNGEHGFQNLFWGLIYGFGWHVAGSLTHFSRSADIFGFFIWPLLVWVVLFLLTRLCFSAPRLWQRRLIWAGLALSLFIVMPGKTAFSLGFQHLPTLNNLEAAAY